MNRHKKQIHILIAAMLSLNLMLSGCIGTRTGKEQAAVISPHIPAMPAAPIQPPAPAPEYKPKSLKERYLEQAYNYFAAGEYENALKTCQDLLLLDPTDAKALEMKQGLERQLGIIPQQPITKELPAPKQEAQIAQPAPQPEPAPQEKEVKKPEPASPEPEPKPEQKPKASVTASVEPPVLQIAPEDPEKLSRGNIDNPQQFGNAEFAHKAIENDFIFSDMPKDITQHLYRDYLFNRSIEVLQEAVRRYPDSSRAPEALLEIGKYHMFNDDFEQAYKAFDTIEQDYHNYPLLVGMAKYYKAEILFKKGQIQNAYDQLTSLLKTTADLNIMTKAYLLRGKCMEELGAWEKAISDYYVIIEHVHDPKLKDMAIARITKTYLDHKHIKDAIKHLEINIKKSSPQGREHFIMELVDLYERTNQPLKERKLLIDFIASPISLDRDKKRAVFALANCYYNLGDFENAFRTYTLALNDYNIKEKTLEALYRKGESAANLGFYKNALEAFDEVVARTSYSPEWVQSKYQRAKIYIHQKKFAKAEADLKDVITFAKKPQEIINAYRELGQLLDKQGKIKQARTVLEKAIDTYKDSQDINQLLMDLATTFAQQGQNQQAIQALDNVDVETLTNNPEQEKQFLNQLANVLFESGQYAKASGIYKSLFARTPKDTKTAPGMLYSLGRCYEMMGQKNSAISTYKKLVEEFPKTTPSQQAQWNIKNIQWQMDFASREPN